MELNEFIANFAEQLDETDPSTLNSETVFKDLEDWNSMVALSVIAMIDADYDVAVNGNTIQNVNTIGELFEAVKQIKG